jgi:flagellar capping protein FliD
MEKAKKKNSGLTTTYWESFKNTAEFAGVATAAALLSKAAIENNAHIEEILNSPEFETYLGFRYNTDVDSAQLHEVGIFVSEEGEITIDEELFRQSVDANPFKVAQAVGNILSDSNGEYRMYESIAADNGIILPQLLSGYADQQALYDAGSQADFNMLQFGEADEMIEFLQGGPSELLQIVTRAQNFDPVLNAQQETGYFFALYFTIILAYYALKVSVRKGYRFARMARNQNVVESPTSENNYQTAVNNIADNVGEEQVPEETARAQSSES